MTSTLSFCSIDQWALAQLLKDAERAHAVYVDSLSGDEKQYESSHWPEWYASYMIGKEPVARMPYHYKPEPYNMKVDDFFGNENTASTFGE